MKVMKLLMTIGIICSLLVLSTEVKAEVALYNFDDGTLQGWTNNAAATENMVTWDTATNSNGGRTVARSADYMVLEENFGDRDSDTNVKVLTSPEFMITATTAVEVWTLGGTGSVDVPTWSNIADLPTTAGADFMGIALRRVSDGEYLLFDRRSDPGQSNRTPNWLAVGWDAAEITAATAGDAATETYVVDLVDAYSGGWGWIGADDVTLTDVTVIYYEAHNPDPYDTEPMVAADKVLSWDAPNAYTAAGYDVYLDPNETDVINRDPSVLVSPKQSGTTLTPSPELDPDTTYYWRVDAYEPNSPSDIMHGAVQTWSFTTAPDTPVIIDQPTSRTVSEGEDTTFTVGQLNGTSYQWYVNDEPIPGATDSSYTVSNVTKADEGYYVCNVSNTALPDGLDTDFAYLWTKRLMAHWAFDDSLVDDVDGWDGKFVDPNENNLNPAATYDTGVSGGKAIRFGSDESHVIVPDSNDFFNFYPHGYTASAWVKTEDWGSVASKEENGWVRGWALTTHQGTATHTLRSKGDLHGTKDVIDNEWHLITISLEVGYDVENPDAKMMRLYVDGVQENQSVYTGAIPLSSSPLMFGVQTPGLATSLEGLVDEVSIWSYAIDPFDIAKMYTDVMTDEYVCVGYPAMDFNEDCVTNLLDFVEFAEAWLDCTRVAGTTSGEINCYSQN